MKFLIDENIPYAEAFFEPLLQQLVETQKSDTPMSIERFAGRELEPKDLKDVDVLLVRSITKVNEQLLQFANRLKFVGTATIGEDHIDKTPLEKRGITFSSAPGCNANSVAEFVISALLVAAEQNQCDFSDATVSIIGVGNIGRSLLAKLRTLGMKVLLCDPLRASIDQSEAFVSLEQALSEGDIVTFHTPITQTGEYPTHHLLGKHNLGLLKDQVCLINASRGEVIDNEALLSHINDRIENGRPAIQLILDVWENEPEILKPLLEYTLINTAHIAGYSLEGKGRGTEILYKRVCELFGIEPNMSLEPLLPVAEISQVVITSEDDELKLNGLGLLKRLVHLVFDTRRDSGLFLKNLEQNGFDWIRKNYPIRREWSALTVVCPNQAIAKHLQQLGFKTQIKN